MSMGITFMTGGLEPGKTGVGDYSRLLARECLRRGVPCRLLALADPDIAAAHEEGGDLPLLRLPRQMAWPERIARARTFLEAGKTDWISFQFVAYSYHPKGIPTGLARHLAPLVAGYRLEWMFHELWLGQYREASLKERAIGWLQGRATRACLAALRPALVHTSNPTYVRCLERVGVPASQLPLFGNIAVVPAPGSGSWIRREAAAHSLPVEEAERCRWWVFGLFGSLRPEWPSEPLFGRLQAAARRRGRSIAVASIGRLNAGEGLWKAMVARYPDVRFVDFGPQSTERISEYLQWLDWGIASTPWQLIGKSSTALSMLEHGLPVIVNRDDVHFPACDGITLYGDEPLLYRLGDDLEEYLDRGPRREAPAERLGAIAGRFLADLEAAGATAVGISP